MKSIYISLFAILTVLNSEAQVAQKVVAEHFTNTKCSICASRNPGLIQNFINYPDVLHVSFYPSSPYSDCFLNNHNTLENDDRTKFYNLFGSTPKLAINGAVQPRNTNFGDATLFDNFTSEMSDVSISSTVFINEGKLDVEVYVIAEADNSLGTEKLLVYLVEDTVFYDAPNGEKLHYNVFRKALTSISGNDISTPSTKGSTVSKTYSEAINSEWEVARIRVFVMLQKASDKSMIQADQSPNAGYNAPSGINDGYQHSTLSIFPNPVIGKLNVSGIDHDVNYKIIDLTGAEVHSGALNVESTIDVSELKSGIHFIRVSNEVETYNLRFVKE